MQAVAALRGGFGGHQVMTVSEGETLRRGEEPRSAKATKKVTAKPEGRTTSAKKAAAKGRKAATAGPSSGTGATPKKTGTTKAATAGPTSGTGATTRKAGTAKRAAR